MTPNYKTYRPPGFGTVSSYLFTEHPQELIDFIRTVFNGKECQKTIDPDSGVIRNVIMEIGVSKLMISQASGDFIGMRTSFYLFVDNPDEVYQTALKQGAKDVFAPTDMDYGDRQGGIIDPTGNYWWISKRLEEKDYD